MNKLEAYDHCSPHFDEHQPFFRLRDFTTFKYTSALRKWGIYHKDFHNHTKRTKGDYIPKILTYQEEKSNRTEIAFRLNGDGSDVLFAGRLRDRPLLCVPW